MLVEHERLVLLHIPKCAGTAIHGALRVRFDPTAILEARNHSFASLSDKDLLGYRYISGHLNWHEVMRVPGPKQVVTALRDPVERILSLYYFWKAHPAQLVEGRNLEGPRLARAMSLPRFLASEEAIVRQHIDNTMVRRLIGRTVFARNSALRDRDREFCVNVALANLRRMNFVAFQETLDEDVPEMMRVLGLPAVGPPAPTNTRQQRMASGEFERVEPEPITREVRDLMKPLIAMDGPFYRTAKQLRFQLRSPYPL